MRWNKATPTQSAMLFVIGSAALQTRFALILVGPCNMSCMQNCCLTVAAACRLCDNARVCASRHCFDIKGRSLHQIWYADQRSKIIVVTEVRKRTRFYPVQ